MSYTGEQSPCFVYDFPLAEVKVGTATWSYFLGHSTYKNQLHNFLE